MDANELVSFSDNSSPKMSSESLSPRSHPAASFSPATSVGVCSWPGCLENGGEVRVGGGLLHVPFGGVLGWKVFASFVGRGPLQWGEGKGCRTALGFASWPHAGVPMLDAHLLVVQMCRPPIESKESESSWRWEKDGGTSPLSP
jgi:hypothetical protein